MFDPRGGCDVCPRENEAARRGRVVVRNSNHHEVLTLVKARPLGLGSDRPADGAHGATTCGLHLDLNHPALRALSEDSEDICPLETVASKCGSPTPASQFSRHVVL